MLTVVFTLYMLQWGDIRTHSKKKSVYSLVFKLQICWDSKFFLASTPCSDKTDKWLTSILLGYSTAMSLKPWGKWELMTLFWTILWLIRLIELSVCKFFFFFEIVACVSSITICAHYGCDTHTHTQTFITSFNKTNLSSSKLKKSILRIKPATYWNYIPSPVN